MSVDAWDSFGPYFFRDLNRAIGLPEQNRDLDRIMRRVRIVAERWGIPQDDAPDLKVYDS